MKDIFIHQRKMSFLKKGLFLLALIGILGFWLLPKGGQNLHWILEKKQTPEAKVSGGLMNNSLENQGVQKEIVSPVFNGQDIHGRAFQISADYAQEGDNGEIDLVCPKGEMDLGNNKRLRVSALKGKFTHQKEKLTLEGRVTVTHGECWLETKEADLDLHLGTAQGDLEVHTVCPGLDIEAKGFSIDQKKGSLTYYGRPRIRLPKTPISRTQL